MYSERVIIEKKNLTASTRIWKLFKMPNPNTKLQIYFFCICINTKLPKRTTTQVPLVRRRSLIETLWVESEAPEARPVFPPSSLFSLLASVSMAALL